jgi:hypothetical protein
MFNVISEDHIQTIAVAQGFSTFWYSRTPKSDLNPYAYPQIKI